MVVESGLYVFAMLNGFKDLPRTAIRFPNKVTIQPTPDFIKWNISIDTYFDMNLIPPYCIFYFEPIPSNKIMSFNTDDRVKEIEDEFNATVNLLRLYKSGKIGIQLILGIKAFIHEEGVGSNLAAFSYGTIIPIVKNEYSLCEAEITLLGTFFEQHYRGLINPDKLLDKNLGYAIMRFELVTLWVDSGEKLIDLVISFENVFGKGSKSLTPEQIARYLNNCDVDQSIVVKDMRQIYKYRNMIVHGSGLSHVDTDDFSELLIRGEDYLRKTISKAIRLNEERKDRLNKVRK
ncbi:MAG: hypothetical protein JRJ66_09815 [Deltaproteobacteria bacterium]|nr:hypothetical protein [Deltaproteobacteria bacterium]